MYTEEDRQHNFRLGFLRAMAYNGLLPSDFDQFTKSANKESFGVNVPMIPVLGNHLQWQVPADEVARSLFRSVTTLMDKAVDWPLTALASGAVATGVGTGWLANQLTAPEAKSYNDLAKVELLKELELNKQIITQRIKRRAKKRKDNKKRVTDSGLS
jgi:hypothetical protein